MKQYISPNGMILTLNTADIITLSGTASGYGIRKSYGDFQDMDFSDEVANS